MQWLKISILAAITFLSFKLQADEEPIIWVSFYENATFRGHWEIKIYGEGKLIAKANENMLDFKNGEKTFSGQIDSGAMANLCTFIENKGFFKINKHYATGAVAVDGPGVFLGVSCNGLTNNIMYYPNSGDTADETSQDIAAIWQKLWSYSQVQAPSLTKYM